MTTTPTVPFVCLYGSANSLIALEHFRRLAQQRGVDVQADWAASSRTRRSAPGGFHKGVRTVREGECA